MFVRYAAAVAFAFAFAPVAAGAAILADGSFEVKGYDTPVVDYCYDGGATAGGPPCAPSPWVGGGVILTQSATWGGQPAEDGVYYAFIEETQTLSQMFTAPAGAYALIWYDSNRSNYGGTQSYRVTLTGSATGTLGTFTSAVGPWVHQSAAVRLVRGGSHTLSFDGLATTDSTAFIDNVALIAVPEPATWALFVAGFGLVGGSVRRRRAAATA